MSVFAIFITTAFVANVVVRDDETGFGPIIRSTRVSKFDYLFGRFTGAFVAGCLAFLSVPLGMMLGAAMPWVDPETIGPFRLADYAYVYVRALRADTVRDGCRVLRARHRHALDAGDVRRRHRVSRAVPRRERLFRSTRVRSDRGARSTRSASRRVDLATKYWTASERNTRLPPFLGDVLRNRASGSRSHSACSVSPGSRTAANDARARRERRRVAAAAAVVAGSPAGGPVAATSSGHALPAAPAASTASGWAQLAALTRFDMRAAFRSPAFVVLLGIGFVNAIAGLWYADDLYGNDDPPGHARHDRDAVRARSRSSRSSSRSTTRASSSGATASDGCTRSSTRRPRRTGRSCVPKILAISLVLLTTIARERRSPPICVQAAQGLHPARARPLPRLVRAAVARRRRAARGARRLHPDARAAQVRRLLRHAAVPRRADDAGRASASSTISTSTPARRTCRCRT